MIRGLFNKFLVLCTLLLATTLCAMDVAYSPPVGGVQFTLNPGTRFSGMPFVNPAVLRGRIVGVTGSSVTIGSGGGDAGTQLTTGTAYYLELTAGPTSTYVGDRFEVDVVATKAGSGNTVHIIAGARTNTMASLPSASVLEGYSFVVRPHVTLGQVGGTRTNPILHGSTVVTLADQLHLFNSETQAFEVYYFLRNSNGTIAQWTKVGGGSTNRDAEIIPPGIGFVIKRHAPTAATITWLGEVRTNAFAQPLGAGNTLVSQPWPTPASPQSRGMMSVNGMFGSTVSTAADKLMLYNGTAYNVYYLLRNTSGSFEQWTLIGGGSTNRNAEQLFTETNALMVSKNTADPNFFIPFTLNL